MMISSHQYNIIFISCRNSSPEHLAEVDEWEIPPGSLTLGEVLGCGAFGQVLLGVLNTEGLNLQRTENSEPPTNLQYVAVKMLHGQ